MKRSRSNDGLSSQIERIPRVRQTLIDAILPPEKFERREPRVFHGPKPAGGGPRNGSWVSDEVLLEIRQRREWLGQTAKQIAQALGLQASTVNNALTYTTRCHIVPGPKP